MKKMIPVAMLLRPSARNPKDIARVQLLATELGFAPSTMGEASLTFRIAEDRFELLFGVKPQPASPRPPGESDYGTPGGYAAMDLPVPDVLNTLVESITVSSPAIRMSAL